MTTEIKSAKERIKDYLDERASKDELFAKSYVKTNKNIDECYDYIVGEARKPCTIASLRWNTTRRRTASSFLPGIRKVIASKRLRLTSKITSWYKAKEFAIRCQTGTKRLSNLSMKICISYERLIQKQEKWFSTK